MFILTAYVSNDSSGHMRAMKGQASLRKCAVSPEHLLVAHIRCGHRWRLMLTYRLFDSLCSCVYGVRTALLHRCLTYVLADNISETIDNRGVHGESFFLFVTFIKERHGNMRSWEIFFETFAKRRNGDMSFWEIYHRLYYIFWYMA